MLSTYYYLPLTDQKTGERKLLKLKEGSKILEQLISAGAITRIPNSNTLRIETTISIVNT